VLYSTTKNGREKVSLLMFLVQQENVLKGETPSKVRDRQSFSAGRPFVRYHPLHPQALIFVFVLERQIHPRTESGDFAV
jgi:hypothetical protein